jgi:ribose transport system substrate-binding protein
MTTRLLRHVLPGCAVFGALLPAAASATTVPAADASLCAAQISDVAVVTPYYSDQPSTKEVLDYFEADAEAAGFTASRVDTRGDLAAVNSEIQNAIAQGADAIVLGQGDPLEFGAGLAAAAEAGIPVFGIDAGVADGVLANITSDNESLGELSAQQIVDAVGEGGKVIMIHFDPFEPVRVRAAAATEVFESNGLQIIEYIQGDPADSTGFADTTVRDLLSKYPEGDVDAIWAGWDATGLGAFQATQETGRTEVVVTSVDGQDFAVDAIAEDNNWIATVRQDWATISSTAVEAITACSAGETPADQLITVPGTLVTAENAADFLGGSTATDSAATDGSAADDTLVASTTA